MLGSCAPKKEGDIEKKEKISIDEEENIDYYTKGIVARETFFNLLEKDSSVNNLTGDFYRIDIGNLLNDKNAFALLTYFTTDTTGKVIISTHTDKGWVNMYEQELEIYHDLNDFRFLRFEDFTGDGIKEILIPFNLAPSHGNFNYHCLKFVTNEFRLIPKFDGLTHPEYDKATNTIHTLHGGGIGNYSASEYKLKNWILRETKNVSSGTAPFEDSVEDYVQIIETFVIKEGNPKKLVKVDSIPELNHKLPPFWEAFFKKQDEHNSN